MKKPASKGAHNRPNFFSSTVLPRPTISLCSQKTQCSSKQLRLGFVLCSKCPALFQNSVAAKNSTTWGQCYVVNVLRYFSSNTILKFFPQLCYFFCSMTGMYSITGMCSITSMYTRVQNVWSGSKSVVTFGLIKILTTLANQ